jgi:hypothetical protein
LLTANRISVWKCDLYANFHTALVGIGDVIDGVIDDVIGDVVESISLVSSHERFEF